MHDELYDRTDWRSFVNLQRDLLGLTQRQLAGLLDMPESMLSMLLRGQRGLDPSRVDAFAAALALDAEGKSWFEALVDLESRSERARRSAFATIRSRLQQRAAASPSDEIVDAQADWALNVVAELALCEGFRPDPAWVARTTSPPLTEDRARETLNRLIRIGVLTVRSDGGWDVLSVRTPSVLADRQAAAGLALREGFAQLMLRAVGRYGNEQHSGLSTMAVSEATADRFLVRLREMEQELVQLAIDDPGPRNRVLIFATQLFPASEYTDTEE
ncbi:MAG: TIGR02147 family protein [Myxococcota bacterium]